MSKRLGFRFRLERSPNWLKSTNPNAPAPKREAQKDWGWTLKIPVPWRRAGRVPDTATTALLPSTRQPTQKGFSPWPPLAAFPALGHMGAGGIGRAGVTDYRSVSGSASPRLDEGRPPAANLMSRFRSSQTLAVHTWLPPAPPVRTSFCSSPTSTARTSSAVTVIRCCVRPISIRLPHAAWRSTGSTSRARSACPIARA